MKSIIGLFDIEDDSLIQKNNYKYFNKNCHERIPKVNHPSEDSTKFKQDIEEVIRCHSLPSLSTGFLRDSEESIEDLFKTYCKENGYNNIDWKKIKDIVKEVDDIVHVIKNHYKRPRPENYLRNHFDTIKSKNSFSYPSGHTTISYFLCDIISNSIPEIRQDLQTLASLIGQARIDNGVHFPSDVEFGRLVGETLASLFISGDDTIKSSIKNKHYRKFGEKMKAKAIETYGNKADSVKKYAYDLAEFLHRTNQIERYKVSFDECLEVSKHLIVGMPPNYNTNNSHILSQANGLVMSHICDKIDNNFKIARIHESFEPSVLERGTPGEFRNFSHASRAGVQYPDPYEIHEKLRKVHNFIDHPWERHVIYEYIHPFCDGNGRSGRIILASDLDYDFQKVNEMIGNDYIDNIVAGIIPKIIENLLKM